MPGKTRPKIFPITIMGYSSGSSGWAEDVDYTSGKTEGKSQVPMIPLKKSEDISNCTQFPVFQRRVKQKY